MSGIRICGYLFLASCTLFFLLGGEACKNKQLKPLDQSDTPASGSIDIVADESFAPLIRDEISTFSNIYRDAKIQAKFLPEMKMVSEFFSHPNIRLMIISRRLTGDEKKYFEQLGLPPREIKIAIDAVAFVINSENPDSNLKYGQVADILSGKIVSWKQINANSSLGDISVVFDNQQSGTVRFLREKMLGENLLTKNAFAVDSNPAVINYVEQNASSLGVIGVSWISDRDDSTAAKFLDRIRVAGISANDTSDVFFVPSKRFIYSRQYPFLRELFIISQEKHSGLGTGFATYVASDEGQRIVQRLGLMPIDNAIRIIELKDQF